MTEPLRPLSIGELLDRTFSLYKQNFKLFVGVSILGPVAVLCNQMALAAVGVGSTHSGVIQNRASIVVTVIVGIVFSLVAHSISAAATVKAVAAVYLGKAIRIGEAYASIKGLVLRLIGVLIAVMVIAGLWGVLIFGVGFGAGAAVAAGVAASGGRAALGAIGGVLAGLIGLVVFIVGFLLEIGIIVRYSLAVQACVVEQLRVGASLKRSKVLTKGSRRRIVTIWVVCAVVVLALMFLFAALFRVILSFLVQGGGSFFARQVATLIAQLISGTLCAPLVTIAMSLVYYDERVRKEAFDLQFMMESLDGATPAEPSSVAPSLG